LAATRAGDTEAFAVLWRAFQPSLLRYLRIQAGQASDDLASETWLEVARSLDRFEGDETGFRAWLFTIARHRRLDWCRRQARRPTTVPAQDVPEPAAGDDPARTVVTKISTEEALALIATLPDGQAEAVALRVIADLDVARVAEIMERHPGAVRVLSHRGLRHLAEALESRAAAATPAIMSGGAQ
jgi:RNA polymerase sigma-70 factor (ECF subfamily)